MQGFNERIQLTLYCITIIFIHRYNIIPVMADILGESVKEKVTRIILAVFRVSRIRIVHVLVENFRMHSERIKLCDDDNSLTQFVQSDWFLHMCIWHDIGHHGWTNIRVICRWLSATIQFLHSTQSRKSNETIVLATTWGCVAETSLRNLNWACRRIPWANILCDIHLSRPLYFGVIVNM